MLAWVEDPATLVLKTAKSSRQSAGLLVKVAGKLSSPTVPLAPISSLQSLSELIEELLVLEPNAGAKEFGSHNNDCDVSGGICARFNPRGRMPTGYEVGSEPAGADELPVGGDPAPVTFVELVDAILRCGPAPPRISCCI